MTDLNQIIIDKISDLTFKDGTKLLNCISNIIIKGSNIGFTIDITTQNLKEAEIIRNKAIKQLSNIVGIAKINITISSSKGKVNDKAVVKHYIDGVKKIILISSGKGGVGKSTMAAVIAQTLASQQYKVGIVDADIYGPSMPHIFGINQKPEIIDNKIIPIESKNVKIMSIGFLIDHTESVAFRGPMATKMIYQLLSLTKWGSLDYLIIDMPPGTGDIHLSILENYHVYGMLLITTPQKISAIDVVKSINLYQKFHIPILGIIENMSYFLDNTGNKLKIFDGDSGHRISQKYNIPLICKIPIISSLNRACDHGDVLTNIVDNLILKL